MLQEDAQTDEKGHGPIDDGWAEDVDVNDLDTFNDRSSIGALLRKCRGLASMVKRSSLIGDFFCKESGKINNRRTLRTDVCTRWNSTLHMIEGFLSLKMIIGAVFDEKHTLGITRRQLAKLDGLELTSSDWSLLKILSELLKPFDLATKLLSAQRYPTIGLCLFALYHIKVFLEDTDSDNELMKRLKRCLQEKMTKYIDEEKKQMQMLRVSVFAPPQGISFHALHNTIFLLIFFSCTVISILSDIRYSPIANERLSSERSKRWQITISRRMSAVSEFSTSRIQEF
jgi:hypothetical protein